MLSYSRNSSFGLTLLSVRKRGYCVYGVVSRVASAQSWNGSTFSHLRDGEGWVRPSLTDSELAEKMLRDTKRLTQEDRAHKSLDQAYGLSGVSAASAIRHSTQFPKLEIIHFVFEVRFRAHVAWGAIYLRRQRDDHQLMLWLARGDCEPHRRRLPAADARVEDALSGHNFRVLSGFIRLAYNV